MATLYTHQSANRWKTVGLMTVFLVVVIAVGWFVSFYYDSPVFLFAAVIGSVAMSFGSYWWSDKIVLGLSRAHAVSPDAGPESRALYRLLENLCITAGLPVPRLYIIEDEALNAFATGRDPEHAVICVTTGLIHRLDKQEMEGVLAHELSHIGNRDILISTIAVVLVGFVALISDFMVRSFLWGRSGRSRDNNNLGQLGAVLMVVGLVFMILSPIAAQLLQLAISRKREFLADASGALLTRNPEGLVRALQKISTDPSELRSANRATAHLFIANPFKRKKGRSSMFSTHPSMQERIAALRGVELS